MDKPEDKPGQPGPLRPPHPPPGVKKPSGIPKGPVPPRGGTGFPGMTPMSPGNAGARPPTPFNKPPTPPMGAPPGGAKPPSTPPLPPAMKPPALPAGSGLAPRSLGEGGGPVPPALNNKLSEADSVKTDLEGRIADLEKKLLEEREKVLLASLRSKEEEAVSAKVETSIKEIQDKLRREKREQELDENRRKAEARALDTERRMAEEREAWVSTLKGQLSQRDQVTQEMETHFSTRLKDLEYRWAQEKQALENALREREAEVSRVRHEFQLKGEQEKAFWEDRVKSLSAERDKFDRELERAKDKFQQEKEHLLMERQLLRDQAAKAESSLKFMEDQHRVEKAALLRESDAALNLSRHQVAIEKDAYEKQMEAMSVKVTQASAQQQVEQEKLKAAEAKLAALLPQLEDYKHRATEVEGLTDSRRKQYELEIQELNNQLSHARMSAKEEIQRIQNEFENRSKTMQTRLDWYDANIKREYEIARQNAHDEVELIRAKLMDVEKTAAEMRLNEDQKGRGLIEARQKVEQAEKDRLAIQQELEQFKADWKQSQWDAETQVKELNSQLKSTQIKLEQAEDARISLEQEMRQRSANAEYNQTQAEQSHALAERLKDKYETLRKELDFKMEKENALEEQIADYKKVLQGKGLQDISDLQTQLQEKANALEKAKGNLQRQSGQILEAEKKDELFKEKEKVLRQMISDKDGMLSEFKNRVGGIERKLEQVQGEYQEFRENSKRDKEKIVLQLQSEMTALKERQEQELEQIKRQKQAELEQAKRTAAEEMEAKIRMELPPPGPNAQMLETQIRQDLEAEFMDRLREKETELEDKLGGTKEESKKELERLRWEADSMKEELRRARESRTHIEREAQELLQQADEHYQRELEKIQKNQEVGGKKTGGLFTAIGRILDTPLIDTNKKKEETSELPPEQTE